MEENSYLSLLLRGGSKALCMRFLIIRKKKGLVKNNNNKIKTLSLLTNRMHYLSYNVKFLIKAQKF